LTTSQTAGRPAAAAANDDDDVISIDSILGTLAAVVFSVLVAKLLQVSRSFWCGSINQLHN